MWIRFGLHVRRGRSSFGCGVSRRTRTHTHAHTRTLKKESERSAEGIIDAVLAKTALARCAVDTTAADFPRFVSFVENGSDHRASIANANANANAIGSDCAEVSSFV